MLDVVKSVSIENLVNQRAAVMERMTKVLALIDEAAEIARAAHLGFPDLRIHLGYRSDHSILKSDGHDAPKLVQHAIDWTGWQYLMAESGLRTFMDAETRSKWDDGYKGDVPELTEANIAATFRTMYDARGDMFEEGVIRCFKGLSWDYKTNLPQKFGKRIVVTYLCYSYGVNHNGTDKLDDLARVFYLLDGKPEPDHRDGMYHTISKAHRDDFSKGTKGQWPKEADTEYLSIRLFKNGNGHITFKRPDLVDGLNRIIAKRFPGALPEPK
jgi:Domain of unknown function (DUF4942)